MWKRKKKKFYFLIYIDCLVIKRQYFIRYTHSIISYIHCPPLYNLVSLFTTVPQTHALQDIIQFKLALSHFIFPRNNIASTDFNVLCTNMNIIVWMTFCFRFFFFGSFRFMKNKSLKAIFCLNFLVLNNSI